MKGTIEFSSRKAYERPASDLGIHYGNPRKDPTPSLGFSNYPKIPFRTDVVNTELSKGKSPDVSKGFLDGKQTPRGFGQSSMISNLRSELTNLKQEASLLALNSKEPLEFKTKHKSDRTEPMRRVSNVENRECSFNLESRASVPTQHAVFQEERTTRRDLDRLRSDSSQKETQISEPRNPVAKLESQLRQAPKSREQLEMEALVAKNTCQQFKEQADRLREELKLASEKERTMFHDQRELLEKLTALKNSKDELNDKIYQAVEKLEKQKKVLQSELQAKIQEQSKITAKMDAQRLQLEKQFKQELQKVITEMSCQRKQSQKQLREDHKRVISEMSEQRKALQTEFKEQNNKANALLETQKKLFEIRKNELEKQLREGNKKIQAETDSQKKEFQKQIKEVTDKLENHRKLEEETQMQITRKKQKQINFLKQDLLTLQKSVILKTAEGNSLQQEKQSIEKFATQKNEQLNNLQKNLAELKEKNQGEKEYSKSLFDEISTKDSIIHILEAQKVTLQKQIQNLKEDLLNQKDKANQAQSINGLVASSFQKNEQQRLRLEGQCRALSIQIERLKNSERIAWEKCNFFQLQLTKGHSKQRQCYEKDRILQTVESQRQQIIRRLEQQIQRHKGSMEELKKVIEQLRISKTKQALAQNQLEKVKKNLQVTQLRNQQLLDNLALKNGMQQKLKNSQQCVTVLQSQIEKKNTLQKLLLDENTNVKKREAATQDELKSINHQLNQLRLADRHSEQLRQQVDSLKSQLQTALLKAIHLEGSLKVLSLSEKTAIQLLNESKTRVNFLAEQILKLNVQIRNSQNEKESFLTKIRQLQAAKPVPISQPVIHVSSTLQDKALREQCAHKDNVICELHMQIGKLQTSLQQIQPLQRRLQKTEELLTETNDLVARLRIQELEGRYQKYRQVVL